MMAIWSKGTVSLMAMMGDSALTLMICARVRQSLVVCGPVVFSGTRGLVVLAVPPMAQPCWIMVCADDPARDYSSVGKYLNPTSSPN